MNDGLKTETNPVSSPIGGGSLKLIECPRDAMQGWKNFIPTEKKISYINSLLKVGFDTIDFGSFVSAKAIPQMADTAEVIRNLEIRESGIRNCWRSLLILEGRKKLWFSIR